MSDRMDLDEDDAEHDGTSAGDASSTQQQPNRQSTNWQDDPEYRRKQSERDRAEAQARRENYELRQRLAQVEGNVHQAAMQNLDREGQLAYQNQLYQQQLAEAARERDLQAYAMQVKQDIDDIVRKTGIPRADLEDALNQPGFSVHQAWQMGTDYLEKNGVPRKRTRQEEIEDSADDRVDLGMSSKPKSKASKILEEWRVARKQYNQRRQVELMSIADEEGIELPDD